MSWEGIVRILEVQFLKVWAHQCCQALAVVLQQEGKMEVTDLHMTFWVLVELVEGLLLRLLEAWA
jgi:hypothetical protein